MVYLLTVLTGRGNNRLKIFCGICSVILMAGLFQLCSKSALFVLFIILTIAFPLFSLRGKLRLRIAITMWALALVAGLSAFKVNAFKERYFSELKTDLSKPVAGESVEPRRARWDVAGQLIMVSPIIGYGAGSETGLLHEAFYKDKFGTVATDLNMGGTVMIVHKVSDKERVSVTVTSNNGQDSKTRIMIQHTKAK